MRSTAARCALLLAWAGCHESDSSLAPVSLPSGDTNPPVVQPTPAGSGATGSPNQVPGTSAPTSAANPIPDWCNEPLTVERLCSRPEAPCPVSATEVRTQACTNKFIWGSAKSNTCGGTSVTTRIGNSGRTWDFDGSGKLVALTSYDDAPFGPCQLNHYVYGTPCEPEPTEEALCAIAGDDAGAEDGG